MLDDLHALVQFAQAGSVVRAAKQLHRTPSAVTRQVQRLESALGAPLLDRSVKPPRLTALGMRVVEHSRELLRGVDELKALTAPNAEPSGTLRIGVSHALADDTLVEPVHDLSAQFPKLRVHLHTDLTTNLLAKLRRAELDLAVVILLAERTAPHALPTKIVASDRMVIVKHRAHALSRTPSWQELAAQPWMLNPAGCLVRNSLLEIMERAGAAPSVAAEVHNMHLQRAFVEANYGLALLPQRFVQRHCDPKIIRIVRPCDFELRISIALVSSGALGSLEAAIRHLELSLAKMHESSPRLR